MLVLLDTYYYAYVLKQKEGKTTLELFTKTL